MKRLEFDAFFDRSLSVFSAAESKSPQLHILKADWSGFRVEVRCSCTQLWKRIAPAISHWAAPVDDHAPDLILHASSNRALQEPLVAPNWIGGQFTEAGVPLDMNGEAVDFDLRFQPWHKLIHAHRDGHGLFWVADPEKLPWWEDTFPFRVLLHWGTRNTTLQLMHAAAVSPDGSSSWLIPGPSGSGKSTTVVSLLESGFSAQGDDYILVDTGENPMVFPLYDSIKLTWDAVGSWFPHLKDKLRLPAEGAKAVSSLTRIGTLARKMPIRGILIPELPSSHEALDSIFCEKISASAAMLAIAPTTLMHLPEDRPQSWARFRALLNQVPTFRWGLSSILQLNQTRFPLLAESKLWEVAVIMPAYNPGPELERAWESLVSQNWFNAKFTLYLVDDASDDGTAKMRIAALAAHEPERIKHITLERNSGPAAARNAGIDAAQVAGVDWIGFCDHDDAWPENKWLHSISKACMDPELQIVGGRVQYHIVPGVEDPIDKYLDDERHISHVHLGAILVRPEVFERIGHFDSDLRFSEDFDWWNRVREASEPFIILENTMLHYHWHGNNSVKDMSSKSLGILDILSKSIQRRRSANVNGKPRPMASLRDESERWRYDVVVPVFNGMQFLPSLLQNIAQQETPPHQVIFVDDASTDGSAEWLKDQLPGWFGNRGKLITLETNNCVAAARNIGWRAGESAWCAFLDQDDMWPPDKHSIQLGALKADRNRSWATTWIQPELAEGFEWPDNWDVISKSPHKCVVPSGWIVARSALFDVNGFNEEYKLGDDLEFAVRMRDRFGEEIVCEDVFVIRRFGEHNNSNRTEEMKIELMRMLRERIGAKRQSK